MMIALLAKPRLNRGAQGGEGQAEEAHLRHLPLASASSTHLRISAILIAAPRPTTLTKHFM